MSMFSFHLRSGHHTPPSRVRGLRSARPEPGSPAWMLARLKRTFLLGACLVLANIFTCSQATPPQATRANAAFTHDRPRAVPPVGWRRTAQGWQHVSTWQTMPIDHRSLNQRIIAQQQNEAMWLQKLMATVRGIPPGCFAMLQLAGVSVVAILAWRNRDIMEVVTRRSH